MWRHMNRMHRKWGDEYDMTPQSYVPWPSDLYPHRDLVRFWTIATCFEARPTFFHNIFSRKPDTYRMYVSNGFELSRFDFFIAKKYLFQEQFSRTGYHIRCRESTDTPPIGFGHFGIVGLARGPDLLPNGPRSQSEDGQAARAGTATLDRVPPGP